MLAKDIRIPGQRFIDWMDLIRKTEDAQERYDLLEAFWKSQLESKYWIIDQLRNDVLPKNLTDIHNISGDDDIAYVFGGWHGLAAITLADNFPEFSLIYSIDKNPKNKYYGQLLCNFDNRINFVTKDMTKWNANAFHPYRTKLIVNTSCEHMTQEEYDKWFATLPPRTLIVLQGNNFHDLPEHVRTSENIEHFKEQCRLEVVWFQAEKDCEQFTRYMIMGFNYPKLKSTNPL